MVEPATSPNYQPPVSQLLSYGDCNKLDWKKFPDYVSELGLTQADVPELMRMMTDEVLWNGNFETLEPWAIVHAWRSLAQLKALEAIEPFIALMDQYEDDDWLLMDASKVLGLYGGEALPTLTQHLAHRSHREWTLAAIAEGIEAIAKAEPELRDRCVEILIQQLAEFGKNTKWLNGALIGVLAELQVVEAAPLMEQAYAARTVDDSIPGTWASVQVELGLRQESDFSEDDFKTQFYKNREAAQLLSNPGYRDDYFDDGPPFGSDRSDLYFDSPPPKFGQGFLEVPKAKPASSPQGFASGAKKSGKKKGKK